VDALAVLFPYAPLLCSTCKAKNEEMNERSKKNAIPSTQPVMMQSMPTRNAETKNKNGNGEERKSTPIRENPNPIQYAPGYASNVGLLANEVKLMTQV
jgi:hypothetical protein